MSNELSTTVKAKVQSLRAYLSADAVKQQIQYALPKGFTADRMLRQVYTLVQTNMVLLDCSQQSIMKGIIRAAELGLELSGPLGQAYLIPRRNKGVMEATFQLGWKGVLSLAYRGGNLSTFRIKTVYQNDSFDWQEGTQAYIKHRPCESGDRGRPTHYYAIATTPSGQVDFEVMTHQEVLAHRDRYSPAPQGKPDYSAWATSFNGMAQKTVALKLAKRLPASTEMLSAVADEEYAEAGVGQVEMARPSRTEALADKLGEVPMDESEVPNEDPQEDQDSTIEPPEFDQ